MNFSGRILRFALIAWALYFVIALAAFSQHVHSSHDHSGVSCALCARHAVTGAVAVATVFVFASPILCWRLLMWPRRIAPFLVAPMALLDNSRAPPLEVFSLTQIT